MLYLNHEEEKTKVLGPGVRYVVWVQGCKRRCPGCINPLGQPLSENGYWKSVAALEQDILHVEGLTGITISGGEPFLQAEALAKLVKLIKENSKLDIMIYSGYTLKQLREMQNADVDYILGHIDLLDLKIFLQFFVWLVRYDEVLKMSHRLHLKYYNHT